MRRLFVAAAVCAAFWLVAGPATAAPRDLPARGHDLAHPTLDAGARTAEPAAAKARIAPLAGRGSAAMVTISGYVFNSSGAPVPEATVEWSAQGYYNTAVTDASGYWASQALPATGDGQLWVYLPDGGAMARQGESFVEGASFTFDPGSLSVTGYRGGPWGDFDDITVRLWGTTRFTRGRVATADTSTTPVTGNFDAMSGSYASGTVHFFSDEGMEFSGAFNVTPYTWSGGTATAYEADAQRITVASPYWASGAPGTVVKVARGNFTPGWVNHVTGASEFPEDAPRTDWGSPPRRAPRRSSSGSRCRRRPRRATGTTSA